MNELGFPSPLNECLDVLRSVLFVSLFEVCLHLPVFHIANRVVVSIKPDYFTFLLKNLNCFLSTYKVNSSFLVWHVRTPRYCHLDSPSTYAFTTLLPMPHHTGFSPFSFTVLWAWICSSLWGILVLTPSPPGKHLFILQGPTHLISSLWGLSPPPSITPLCLGEVSSPLSDSHSMWTHFHGGVYYFIGKSPRHNHEPQKWRICLTHFYITRAQDSISLI